MLRSWAVILLALISSSTPSLVALDTATPVPLRLQATCLGASSEVAPQRIAVRWNGSAPLDLVAWGDADGDRVRDPGEEIVAIGVVDPGYTVLELDRMPEAPLVVGPESDSLAGVAVVLAGSCEWSGDFFFADLDGTVRAFAVYNDGSGARLYVGGEFGIAGDRVVNHIARWDGTSWSPLSGPGGVVGANSNVLALAVHAGALYVGGDFTTAGGLAASHIARWGAAGWSTLEGTNGPIRALISHDDGSGSKLYAGGSFSTAGGVAVGNIARWNGTAWESLGTSVGSVPGVTGPVSALERFTDGGSGYKLFVGGAFTSSSAGAANYIARWNGTAWSSVGDGASNGVDGAVRALEATGGSLYVGGLFEHAGDGIVCRAIARWDGAAWSALGTGMFLAAGGTGAVRALYVYDDGMYRRLYAGGEFDYAGGQPAKNLAVWTGSAWTGQVGTSMAGMSLPVWALGEFGYELYAGGEFVEAGGVTARRVARWNGLPAQTWRALENRWGQGFDDDVFAWAVYDEGEGPRLFAGGSFTHVGPTEAKYLARWDGEQWSAVEDADGGSLNWRVNALVVHENPFGTKLYAGGYFTQPGNHVAAWNGSTWAHVGDWGAGEGTDGVVWALASFNAGAGPNLYVGGDFHAAGVTPAEGVARYDGSSWRALIGPFSPPDTVVENGEIHALEVFDDGNGPDLYVGGYFELSVTNAVNLARWSGTAWSTVGALGPDHSVNALLVHDDGSGRALYAGGFFTHVDAIAANRVARWNGSAWSALSGPSGNGVDDTVWALASYDDGDGPALYAAGLFTQAGGAPVERIARWDGSAWSSLPDPSGLGLNGQAFALRSYDDGSGPALWVGGGFSTAGDKISSHVARWSCGQIFEDGFESGGPTAWDSAVGVPGGP
jgi:trimeric autotransporter adhesin